MTSSLEPPKPLRSFEVVLRTGRVRYEDSGPGEDPQGRASPAILMLHDLTHDRRSLSGLAARLSPLARVVVVDLPGHGESDGIRPVRSWSHLSSWLGDLVAAVGLGRLTLLGHGLGGAVGILGAADAPEFFERLILVAPLCFPPRRSLAERIAGMPVVRHVAAARVLLPWVSQDRAPPGATPTSYREHVLPLLPLVADPSPVRARLPRLKLPSLVIWGRVDPIQAWTEAGRVARELSTERIATLDAGHSPHLERPEEVARIITAFLREGQTHVNTSGAPTSARTATPSPRSAPPSSRSPSRLSSRPPTRKW